MRLGIDLDGCAYPFVEMLRGIVTAGRRVRNHLPDPTQWDFWHDWELTFEEWKHHFDKGVESGILFGHGHPTDAGTINRLAETHSIHVVTDRPEGAHPTTRAWLRKHAIRYDTLTFTADKASVPTDVFIDDKPENVRALCDAGVDAVLLDRPWNRGPNSAGLHRIYSWREFRDHVKAVGG